MTVLSSRINVTTWMHDFRDALDISPRSRTFHALSHSSDEAGNMVISRYLSWRKLLSLSNRAPRGCTILTLTRSAWPKITSPSIRYGCDNTLKDIRKKKEIMKNQAPLLPSPYRLGKVLKVRY